MPHKAEKNDQVFGIFMANSFLGKVEVERKKRGESRSLFIRFAIQRALYTKKCYARPEEIHVKDDRRRLPRELKNSPLTLTADNDLIATTRVTVRIPQTLFAKIDSVRRESRSQFFRNAIAEELKVRMGDKYDVTDFEIRAPDRVS